MAARLKFECMLRSAVLPPTTSPMPVCTIVATVPVSTAAVKNTDPWTSGAHDDNRAVGSADTCGSSMEACATSLPGLCWDDCQRACRGNRRNGQYENLSHDNLTIYTLEENRTCLTRTAERIPSQRSELFWRRRGKRQSLSTNSACRIVIFYLPQYDGIRWLPATGRGHRRGHATRLSWI